MGRSKYVVGILVSSTLFTAMAGSVGQTPQTIDFARDVQPILTERCIGCHGPTQQMNGYRVDRRSAALGGVTRSNIVPGSSESSRMYRRITGSQFGAQMPPTGPLPQEEIDILRLWIDAGAEWPEALANELALPGPDSDATRLIEAIRRSERSAALEQIATAPFILSKPGPGGATPLMQAALSGDAGLIGAMLQKGADPNVRNHVGATALMWALEDVESVGLLLDAGADANATSDYGRTPLVLAAAQSGAAPVVKLLLEHGAAPALQALVSASSRADAATVRILLAAGARDTGAAAIAALRSNCRECLEAIAGAQPIPPLRNALINLLPAPGPGNAEAIREAIDRGADVKVKDVRSRTVLMRAAIVDNMSAEIVQLLVDQGADIHEKTSDGLTALDFARRLGNTAVVDAMVKAGATSGRPEPAAPRTFLRGNSVRGAVQRSLPLLQRTALQFYKKSGCVSCHHNSLTEMSVAEARQKGFAIDESLARLDLETTVKDIGAARDRAIQAITNGGTTATGYFLMGLSAERHRPDAATDALVRLLRITQQVDGHWSSAYRPPLEASEFTATAVSLRGIQLYGSSTLRARDEKAVRAGATWLANARPQTTEDLAFRLFGLTWARAEAAVRQSALKELIARQRSDGGWAQLTSLQSDAYATGESLVALSEAGFDTRNSVYRRGVRFLLSTQLADGSWFVQTRAHPTQIYFESGFPHGLDQYISAAATNWATLALIRAEPPPAPTRRTSPQVR